MKNMPSLIVFCGPPCSGKTTLARELARCSGITHLQMDLIRERIFPGTHRGATIDSAYELMHAAAEDQLNRNRGVIVDSTYGRYRQRAELVGVALKRELPAFVIQCSVTPELAVKRFLGRGAEHPASDLTAERVRLLSEVYPFSSTSVLCVQTSIHIKECLRRIRRYLKAGESTSLVEWVEESRHARFWPGPPE